MSIKVAKCLAVLTIVTVTGCATIVGDPTQVMPIKSTPSDAKVLITDENGVQVYQGKTPTTVTLQKSDGSYWGGKSYTVVISKEGHKTQTIPVTTSPSGWYIAGNFVFGGIIGWFIVDPLNGNMYNLSPEAIDSTLAEESAHNNSATDGSITVMLLQDVPQEFRDKMVRID